MNADIMSGVPMVLPPLRDINHRIQLVDERMKYNYYSPRCPESMRLQQKDKLIQYEQAGWWVRNTTEQAAPMMCIPKKNGKIRTVVDLRKRNDNTVRDVTPLPDQDQIRTDVARAKIRSKIDLSNAYEQVRIVPEDVHKTSFATIFGTYESNVMQQGDCNAPATFQRLMTHIFRDYLGNFIHCYLDDLFVFSDTLEDHERQLAIVFDLLRKHHLYLEGKKCELFAEKMDCLGHIIDDKGLHADGDKMEKIRTWRTPRSFGDIQRFLGLVQYIQHFMPDVSEYTSPLSAILRLKAFQWRPLHEKCFQMIKHLACKTPILRPIDHANNEPIWLVCDASRSGI